MKANTNDIIFDSIKYLFLIFIVLITLLPFVNILAVSLNDPLDTIKGEIGLWPRVFSMQNYASIFEDQDIWLYTLNSVGRTVISGFLHIFCNAMVAYTLSRKKFVLRVPITFMYLLTMYITAGLLPDFFLIQNLGLIGTFNVYWITGITTAWNIIILRTYIKGLPDSLIESAQIEGANEFYIFLRIIIPLCMPVLATLILFTAVWHWNWWFDTFLYNMESPQLYTLQYELMRKVSSASSAREGTNLSNIFDDTTAGGGDVTPRSLRAAMTMVVTAPIILVYPFLQRYFVSGLTIGGVKE
jgi:putative aldouronate transport system permease protein